jgi:anti-sigma factor RsiW
VKSRHFKREILIDFIDGGLAEHVAAEVRDHLEGCRECRDYVRSLERAFSLAGDDAVPEQPEAYWAGFGDGVRARLRSHGLSRASGVPREISRRSLRERIAAGLEPRVPRAGVRRLALVVSPALAVAIALAFALTRQAEPEHLAKRIEPPLDQMTISEIAASMSEDALFDDMLIQAAEEEISAIEEYLLDTEGVNRMIEALADDDMSELAGVLADLMKQKGTQILRKGTAGDLS